MPAPAPVCTSTSWPRGGEFAYRGRYQTDAVFMNLDFFGNADAHCLISQFAVARA